MSELRQLLLESTGRLLAQHCTKEVILAAESGTWPAALWDALTEAGITTGVLPEDRGGSGLSIGEALRVAGPAAACSAPVPLGETLVASWLATSAGLALPAGPATIAPAAVREHPALQRRGNAWHFAGALRRIPYGRDAAAVVLCASSGDTDWIVVLPKCAAVTRGTNLALEPRDDLVYDLTLPDAMVRPAPAGFGAAQLRAAGAALRTVQMASVLGRVLDISLRYAQERVQFGRPIAKFQAIQHHLSVLATQAAAAGAAAELALESFEPTVDLLNAGAAKLRAGEAAGSAAAIAHAVHGAIGFTKEYELNLHTRRLWAWRDEFGKEIEWALAVGREMAKGGADGLWAGITRAGQREATATAEQGR